MDNKQLAHLQEYAAQKAWSIIPKMPRALSSIYTAQDLAQELVLEALKYEDRWDGERSFDVFMRTIVYNHTKALIMSLWDRHNAVSMQPVDAEFSQSLEILEEEEQFEVVVYKNKTLEEEYQEQEDEAEMVARLEVTKERIEKCCKYFNLAYDDNNPLDCLVRVCDQTLNKLPEEKWKEIPYDLQKWLADCGAAISRAGLAVADSKGSIKSKKIVQVIRDLIAEGTVVSQQIFRHLDEQGVVYNKASVTTIIYEERKKAGLQPSTGVRSKTITKTVTSLFAGGKGIITVPLMVEAVREKGIKFRPSTVRTLVSNLRKQYGLTPPTKKVVKPEGDG